MARGGWGQGPIDINPENIRMPSIPKPPKGSLQVGLVVVAVLILLFTGYYQVEPDEVGVVQRFGAYVRTTDPGPHLKIPFGVETVTKVPVQRQLKQEFGFETARPGVQSEFRTTPQRAQESLMLTGDLNVAVVEWIVQYRIRDPKDYLFHLRDVEQTFRVHVRGGDAAGGRGPQRGRGAHHRP